MTLLERFAAGRLPAQQRRAGRRCLLPRRPRLAAASPTRSAVLRRVRRLAAAGIAILGLADLVSAVVPPQVAWAAPSSVRLHPPRGERGSRRPRRPRGRRPARRSPAGSAAANARPGSSRYCCSAGTVALHLDPPRRGRPVGRRPRRWWRCSGGRGSRSGPALTCRLCARACDTARWRRWRSPSSARRSSGACRRRDPSGQPISLIDGLVGDRRPTRRHPYSGTQPASGRLLLPGSVRDRTRAAIRRSGARLPARRRPAAIASVATRYRRACGRRRSPPRHGHARLLRPAERQAGLPRARRARRVRDLRRDLPRVAGPDLRTRKSATSSGRRFAASRTSTAGRSPCSALARSGCPSYRRSGMHERYIGDEGVVDVRTFSLEGGTRKGLRQAVNRIAKYGYTISFHDPARIGPGARGGGAGRSWSRAAGARSSGASL